jgi:ABC-2 type transport system permease protein
MRGRLYLELMKTSFQASLAYRMEVFLHLFRSTITLFIQASIWIAIYIGNGAMASSAGSISLREMMTYAVLSSGISVLLTNNIIQRVDQKYRSGEIAMDLIKPIDFKMAIICEAVGKNAFRAIFELVPLVLVGALVFGMQGPAIGSLAFFAVSILLSAVILYLLTYVVSLLVLWYEIIWHFDALLNLLITLLSGAFIPLWFFPKFLSDLSMFLPFKLIYYAPIAIYLEKTSLSDALWMIAQQALWIGALILLGKWVWRRGIKKMVVQGG